MNTNWKQRIAGVGLGAFVLGGCYPSESLTTEELDVVATVYDEEVDFSRFKTYAMPDTIVQIGDPDSEFYIDLELTREEMDFVLNLIRNNMSSLNYTDLSDSVDANGELIVPPDVGIFVEVLAEKRVVLYTYPGYGWGGWYPPRVGGYTYPVGTVTVNYIDVEGIVQGDSLTFIPTPWLGIANGLLFETSNNQARITNNINQMFDQSQYLRAGN